MKKMKVAGIPVKKGENDMLLEQKLLKIKNTIKTTGFFLMLSFVLTGCYPNGEIQKQKDNNEDIAIESNVNNINMELDENLSVNADLEIELEAKWKNKKVVLKNWNVDEVAHIFGEDQNIARENTMPDVDNENYNDHYIYWEDESMLILQRGKLQYFTKRELEYSYLSYLYGIMPYLTNEAMEKFPETEIPELSKEDAILEVKGIVEKLGIEVSEPKVYSLTYEKLEANTDYTQLDPNGNEPHKWGEEDAVYAVAFKGMSNSLPITEVGYRSGPAAGERIVGIVGKQGLIALQALNIYELQSEGDLEKPIVNVEIVLESIRNKFRNVLITDEIEIEKISLEYVPVLEDLEAGIYQLKPMYVCMAKQNIKRTQEKEDKGVIEESGRFPIIFDACTGTEIQTGGAY